MSNNVVAGIRLGTICAGIKKNATKDDLTLIELVPGSQCAAVFTRNAFRAAPVELAAASLQQSDPLFLLINSGNANAGTGKPGLQHAQQTCRSVAEHGGCDASQVLPFSTGVIGETLPVEKICTAIPAVYEKLSEHGWEAASLAIMTTDTRPKLVTRTVQIDDQIITITGISKGAGMIEPNMATMLAYVATDAAVDKSVLQACLTQAVDVSFNQISVDGDTSTNDACVLMATGAAGNSRISELDSPQFRVFAAAVTDVCVQLAKAIVQDGEGASKFITLLIEGARDQSEASRVGKTVANSPLVKTAFFASDPNWGRILAAVGRAGLEQLNINAVNIYLGDVCIVAEGGRAENYCEQAAQLVMDEKEITVRIELGRGNASATVWTCDFSYDYVRINAEYRT